MAQVESEGREQPSSQLEGHQVGGIPLQGVGEGQFFVLFKPSTDWMRPPY